MIAFTGTTGAYVCEIDTPWTNLITSFATYTVLFVFPQMVNQTTYVTALLSAFAAMGPGDHGREPCIHRRQEMALMRNESGINSDSVHPTPCI